MKTTNINFLRLRYIAYAAFAVLLTIFFTVGNLRGGINMGIDFVGGAKIMAKFSDTLDEGNIREVLSEFEPMIQRMGERVRNEFVITTKIVEEGMGGQGALADLKAKLLEAYPDVEILSEENVGPAVSGMMARSAVQLIIISIFMMTLYLTFRFEFKYSVSAMLSLIGSVVASIGFITAMGIEITIPVIAGLLTIFGYTINDTIVVFDRIRENFQYYQAQITAYDVINKSINQTLIRTILTTFTTLFAVIALFFFGGEVLRPFATVLVFGISTSVLATTFLAAPLLYEWEKIKSRKK